MSVVQVSPVLRLGHTGFLYSSSAPPVKLVFKDKPQTTNYQRLDDPKLAMNNCTTSAWWLSPWVSQGSCEGPADNPFHQGEAHECSAHGGVKKAQAYAKSAMIPSKISFCSPESV